MRTVTLCSAFLLAALSLVRTPCPAQAQSVSGDPDTETRVHETPPARFVPSAAALRDLDRRLRARPQGQQPLQAHTAYTAQADGWQTGFGFYGLNDRVNAIAVIGSDVYVGGAFTDAGGVVNLDYLARWDGTNWLPLGARPPSPVSALATVGDDLYVLGTLYDHEEPDDSYDYLMRWDGTRWHDLYDGPSESISAIAADGQNLYVVRKIPDTGNPGTDEVVRWDGTQWHALGGDLGASIGAIVTSGPSVYIAATYGGGSFSDPSRVLRWDGGSWQPLGREFDWPINVMVAHGPDVYIASRNSWYAGDHENAHGVLHWNGVDWQLLDDAPPAPITALATDGVDLYASWTFGGSGDPSAATMARWDGTRWHDLGVEIEGGEGFFSTTEVNAIAVNGSDVYVGGNFNAAGDTPGADYIARWDGAAWNTMSTRTGNGLNTEVDDIALNGTDVYVGGDFTDAGGNPGADCIARWDGTRWHALGTGLCSGFGINQDDEVWTIAVNGSDVYAGGNLDGLDENSSYEYIVHWDGSRWQTLGEGLPSTVSHIEVIGSDVYAAGSVILVEDRPVDGIARWDGMRWHDAGAGLEADYIGTMAVHGTDLYVAYATFDDVFEHVTSHAARWDGAAWHPFGDFEDVILVALAANGTDVYAAGYYLDDLDAEGLPTKGYLGRWDGAAWHPLGDTFEGLPVALALHGANLYAGGYFSRAGGNTDARNIARWDGSRWHGLGPGLNDYVLTLAVKEDTVYAGGGFTHTGDGAVVTARFGVFTGATSSVAVEEPAGEVPAAFVLAPAYPNPFNPSTTLAYTVPRPAHVTIRIYDVLGRLVATPIDAPHAAGRYEVRWEAGGIASGTYLCRLEAGGTVQTRLLVLAK